jgi:hypothetical protein
MISRRPERRVKMKATRMEGMVSIQATLYSLSLELILACKVPETP